MRSRISRNDPHTAPSFPKRPFAFVDEQHKGLPRRMKWMFCKVQLRRTSDSSDPRREVKFTQWVQWGRHRNAPASRGQLELRIRREVAKPGRGLRAKSDPQPAPRRPCGGQSRSRQRRLTCRQKEKKYLAKMGVLPDAKI